MVKHNKKVAPLNKINTYQGSQAWWESTIIIINLMVFDSIGDINLLRR